MITIILIICAAIFKAVADTIQHHYSDSIFRNLPLQFWDANVSWKYIKFIPFTKYRPDAWHLSNSAMIICFICASVFNDLHFMWYWQVLALGVIFNVVFELFYSKIFLR